MDTPPDDNEELKQAVAEFRMRQFSIVELVAPVGLVGCSLAVVELLDPESTPRYIGWWLAAVLAIAVLLAFVTPSLGGRWLRPNRLLPASTVGHLLAGLGFGSIGLLDIDLFRESRTFLLAVVAGQWAMVSGVLVSRTTTATVAFSVLAGMWLTLGLSLALAGYWWILAAILLFSVLAYLSISGTAGQVFELIRLRHESEQHAATLTEVSRTDALTGLLNRSRTLEVLAESDTSHWLLFVDLDGFKGVNDRFGHLVGDRLLEVIGRRLQNIEQAGSFAARLGGDEFMVLAPRAAVRADQVEELGTTIIEKISQPVTIEGVTVHVSASVGVAKHQAFEDPLDAVRRADQALYAAKEAGRSRVVVHTDAIAADAAQRAQLEVDLRQALSDGGLAFAGQPVFHLESGAVEMVELMSRWTRADGSLVPPTVFVPMAQRAGLGHQLTTGVLTHAADLLARWANQPPLADLKVAVNVAPGDLGDRWLLNAIAGIFAAAGAPTSNLIVELTEGEVVADLDQAQVELADLASMGVVLALDDFGSGYSSLGQVMRLPVRLLKIDGQLIQLIGTNQRFETVVGAISATADILGLEVVAEWIEHGEQLDSLRSYGITYGQGDLLAPPMGADELECFLAKREPLYDAAADPS